MTDLDALEQAARAVLRASNSGEELMYANPVEVLRLIAAVREADALRAALREIAGDLDDADYPMIKATRMRNVAREALAALSSTEPSHLESTMTERREPATEAGREYIATVSADTWSKEGRVQWAREFVIAIEAQATDARVAALREALTDLDAAWVWVRDNSPATLRAMPTETFRAFDRIQRFLADLPAAAAERPLDVERLTRALASAEVNCWANPVKHEMGDDELRQHRLDARAIAAEYARLSEADR